MSSLLRALRSLARTPGFAAVTVRFAGDPGVVGETFGFNGESQQIVGVMPKGFAYPPADVWVSGATLLSAAAIATRPRRLRCVRWRTDA